LIQFAARVWLLSSDVTGERGGRISYGPTAVIDPRGTVVDQVPLMTTGMALAEIDSMIRAVLFDLFETLITESRFPPTRASGLGEALGLEGDAFRVEWKARRPLVMVGQLSFGEALTEISMALAGSVNAVAVQRVCEQRVREKAIAFAEIDQGIAAMITELSSGCADPCGRG
jgi:hypothetical protein